MPSRSDAATAQVDRRSPGEAAAISETAISGCGAGVSPAYALAAGTPAPQSSFATAASTRGRKAGSTPHGVKRASVFSMSSLMVIGDWARNIAQRREGAKISFSSFAPSRLCVMLLAKFATFSQSGLQSASTEQNSVLPTFIPSMLRKPCFHFRQGRTVASSDRALRQAGYLCNFLKCQTSERL